MIHTNEKLYTERKLTGKWASGVQNDTDWGDIVHRVIQIGERLCTGWYRLGRESAQDDTDLGEIVHGMIQIGERLCTGCYRLRRDCAQDDIDWGEIVLRMIQTGEGLWRGWYRLGRYCAQDETDWGEIVHRMHNTSHYHSLTIPNACLSYITLTNTHKHSLTLNDTQSKQCTMQKRRSLFFTLDCLPRRTSKWKLYFLMLVLKFIH